MQIPILSHSPPQDFRIAESEPGRDIRLVVHVCDHNLIAYAKRLAYCEAHEPDEGGSVHAESDFSGIARIEKQRDTLSAPCNYCIDLSAFRVAPASLDVVGEQVAVYSFQDSLRYLRPRRVVEKDKFLIQIQGR